MPAFLLSYEEKNRDLFIFMLVSLVLGIVIGLLIGFFFPLDLQSGINF